MHCQIILCSVLHCFCGVYPFVAVFFEFPGCIYLFNLAVFFQQKNMADLDMSSSGACSKGITSIIWCVPLSALLPVDPLFEQMIRTHGRN